MGPLLREVITEVKCYRKDHPAVLEETADRAEIGERHDFVPADPAVDPERKERRGLRRDTLCDGITDLTDRA
jgi:hypothetical protein